MSAIVMKVPCSGDEVRKAWRELQPRIAGLDGVNREQGFVFVPEWQWADGVKDLWVGVEVAPDIPRQNVPAGAELLALPARTYATVRAQGNRQQMYEAYDALGAWFRDTGRVRDVSEGSFSLEANSLQPVNPFDIPADEIDEFDFHIYAPIRA
ncbi:hypothetical protein SD70_28130 [Gordoniibacillus kamchatkensis]|uniref:Bacterial transcription activator effector binding domain-containing protein n=2 Tax=Gordoniibacillus kamchatkensis TaxID=1590651 RepID=A0ABR5AAU2_9BACL|nr:hypothetical protein SD70_28130 [Paenibacillus sp. VKM B-2647]